VRREVRRVWVLVWRIAEGCASGDCASGFPAEAVPIRSPIASQGLKAEPGRTFISIMPKHNTPTIIPASYPALEAEVYNLMNDITERDTIAPPPSSQLTLELECAGVEVEW
jgi:hypothetical protein